MADNFLDKKFEEHKARANSVVKVRKQTMLNTLLLKNRSCRGYDGSFIVRDDQLRSIVDVNTRIPSARNAQALRFRVVNHTQAARMLPLIRLGSALPDLHLPMPGTEPNAYIIICSTVPENKFLYIDLGISAQSMLLRAVELGLAGICIGAFDKEAVKREFALELEPLLILAIGRSAEDIRLVDISPEESHSYYRKDGVHYVPKLRIDDIII